MRWMLATLALAVSTPASAAAIIGTTSLGTLGVASGSAALPEAASYDPADEQVQRFTFALPRAGSLRVALNYTRDLESPLQTICPDPEDPFSCYVEPTGDYQDFSGVDLRRFSLTPDGGSTTNAALPAGFDDAAFGGPGFGKGSYGFSFISFFYELEKLFDIAAGGNFTADVAGFGLIRGPDFTGPGGGTFDYTFEFTPTAVPEPATWAMLICGFGIMGTALRRARKPVSLAVPT